MKPENDKLLSDDQAEPDWTKLSIPNINTPPVYTQPSTGSTSKNKFAQLDSISTPLLLPEQYLSGESDSSTNFDPQAWKRGDKGVGKGKTRMLNSTANRRIVKEQNNNRGQSTSSFFVEPAFIPPTTISPVLQTQHRRAVSSSRRASRPNQSLITNQPITKLTTHTRPSSDLGPPSKLSASKGTGSNPPTWKAYIGRIDKSASSSNRTLDHKQEFLQALSNLQAMAKVGKFEWLSNSNNSSGNDDEDEEDPDTDEPRPGHADLPTSTFNSAIGEDDTEDHHLLPTQPYEPQPDSQDPNKDDNRPLFNRWWSYIEGAISLKTWQFIGLGGIIFGFGICAGSVIGRHLSSKNSKMIKLFSLR
ncbi:hypothetical protein MJO28_015226 [Puccinia striiformis f. sp. tritici]|uniref:Uncharacterized protein n=4 Tax=Puccinia striiformis TaxID=27350 RepID=A0A0L0VVN8_9BASI|nr:hypothetical protein Pst134EA_028064 [Puccinia striiformis f. sp. tritici]KNF03262.1 hypothetical protein PSTG_03527 [Puccinia striiformis f. sp. tritici PST-78]POW00660.1 hypothetical protein PSTT_12987 [Puccinia striiformis]KAH9448768.1 hypothetical protein Pst134EA_028064 [Puccinia striiformis f. sp. tritici]KAI7937681.1 hypothetical protein MJO29_014996 [Puccinia striiformis f. sp. tritici]KAI7938306.1 hypothetical protein MJO28_015226 [Puccinia striiformis f. sp. tritici]